MSKPFIVTSADLARRCIVAAAALSVPLLITTRPGAPLNRLACLIALLGQPFWLYETMRADQFGMFLISLYFTGWYAFGLLRPRPTTDPVAYVDLQSGRLS